MFSRLVILHSLVLSFALSAQAVPSLYPLRDLKSFVDQMGYSPVVGTGVNFSACQLDHPIRIHYYLSQTSGPARNRPLMFRLSSIGNSHYRGESVYPIEARVYQSLHHKKSGQPLQYEILEQGEGRFETTPWTVFLIETQSSYQQRRQRAVDCIGAGLKGRFVGIIDFSKMSHQLLVYEVKKMSAEKMWLLPRGYFVNGDRWSAQQHPIQKGRL